MGAGASLLLISSYSALLDNIRGGAKLKDVEAGSLK